MELAAAPLERECLVRRTVAGRQSPDVPRVAAPAAGIGDRIGALRERGAARVLEVIDPAAAHVGVLDVAEIDPDVRVLVAEQRRELDEARAGGGAPLGAAHPGAPT